MPTSNVAQKMKQHCALGLSRELRQITEPHQFGCLVLTVAGQARIVQQRQ
jgi:hypothetical protein